MELETRREIYNKIEKYRGRPLIVYATTTRPNVRGMMAGDAIREFVDQIDQIDEGNSVDVLIHSTGGDGLTAWKLMSLLRERFESVTVLVPNAAFSAATMFALGADDIVLHPNSSLGPIDPQSAVIIDGRPFQYGYEDIKAFYHLLRDQHRGSAIESRLGGAEGAVKRLFDTVNPLVVGTLSRASELANDVGARMLRLHMKDERRAKQIARDLNHNFYSHGDAVSRSRAIELGLNVAERDSELERLLWEAYVGIESYMDLRTPFNPVEIYRADSIGASALQRPPALAVPPNAPPELVQQLWQTWAQQQIQTITSGNAPEVAYRTVHATIESTRIGSHYVTDGMITCFYNPDGDIVAKLNATREGWRPVDE